MIEVRRALCSRGVGFFSHREILMFRELLDSQLQSRQGGSQLVAGVLREAALGAEQLLDAFGAEIERRSDLVDLGHATPRRRQREVTVAESGRRTRESREGICQPPTLDQREAERGTEREDAEQHQGEERAADPRVDRLGRRLDAHL